MPDYAERISKTQSVLAAAGLDGVVLAPTNHMRYLTGWAEQGYERLVALLVPVVGAPVFIVPEMNAAQAHANAAGITDVRAWTDTSGWSAVARAAIADLGLCGAIAVDDELPAAHLLGLQSLVPGGRWEVAGPLLASLREIKGADELNAMRRSAAVADEAYGAAPGYLRAGMTETDLQAAIGGMFRERGATDWFALVCFGANGAHPHHHSGRTTLCRGDVVIMDIGCTLDGYSSDITRTVAFGAPDAAAPTVYGIVHDAHQAALSAAAPGVECQQVDRAARAVIEGAGYGPTFMHRAGHGIGMSCHEPPYIVEGNRQALRVGMCFSDEPGIYLEGRFGVRIENILTITEDGAVPLNAPPPEHLVVLG